MRRGPQRAWVWVTLLAVLGGVLAILQYRWIGEVSRAEKERLQDSLQVSLQRLSEDFNLELNLACAAIMPRGPEFDGVPAEDAYRRRYLRWKDSGRSRPLFRRLVLAIPEANGVLLRQLDFDTAQFATIEWPSGWEPIAAWIRSRLDGAPMGLRDQLETISVVDLPRFEEGPMRGRREQDWLLAEIDTEYVKETLLPELLARHLGTGPDRFAAEVVVRRRPDRVIYQSQPGRSLREPDGSVSLFEVQFEPIMRGGPGEPLRGRGGIPRAQFRADSGRGRWLLSVQHSAGSLERIVQAARWRNLGVSAAIFILILITISALLRYSRQAHRLAELQMNFVAGISHELRTPLTVIRTAAYNLRGRMAQNPAQVERYGALIQEESEKLTDIVEQVLRYASTSAGQVIREREAVAVEDLIESALNTLKTQIQNCACVVEKNIAPGLPLISGDSTALRHALQNVVHNAIKYGTEASKWIGISAAPIQQANGAAVEIRIADRGPGIPAEEQAHIFDAFYRGKRALQDQIHGTGLGLNLVKKIIEAHGGEIFLRSEAMQCTEFVIRIPAAPAEQQDEFAYSLDRG